MRDGSAGKHDNLGNEESATRWIDANNGADEEAITVEDMSGCEKADGVNTPVTAVSMKRTAAFLRYTIAIGGVIKSTN